MNAGSLCFCVAECVNQSLWGSLRGAGALLLPGLKRYRAGVFTKIPHFVLIGSTGPNLGLFESVSWARSGRKHTHVGLVGLLHISACSVFLCKSG